MGLSPEQALDAIESVFGRHPGARRLHPHGILLRGTFTARPEAARLTRAAHMQGHPVPVVARVSNGAGDPRLPDYRPDVRGLAVAFELGDGLRTDIVAQTSPRFPVRTPDEFIELLEVLRPSPAMAWRLPRFIARHPYSVRALFSGGSAGLTPPESYATCCYYAIHSYRWLDDQGGSRYVRYTWLPAAGDRRLGVRAARRRGANYLHEEIRERVARGPVSFRLEVQVAAPGDNVDDPSATWPRERARLIVGELDLSAIESERSEAGLVFDPAREIDGIELSNDPVLRFRPRAYAVSMARRGSE